MAIILLSADELVENFAERGEIIVKMYFPCSENGAVLGGEFDDGDALLSSSFDVLSDVCFDVVEECRLTLVESLEDVVHFEL